jgi:PUA domain protein
MKIKNRHRLKKKEMNQILDYLQSRYDIDLFHTSATVESGRIEEYTVVFVNGEIDFFYFENIPMFTLRGLEKYHPQRYYVIVDMGAIQFVTNGADIMAPGIIDADVDIEVNDLVWISDERYHKPLAIGKAVVDGRTMKEQNSGKAVKNIHYVGDKLWHHLSAVQ